MLAQPEKDIIQEEFSAEASLQESSYTEFVSKPVSRQYSEMRISDEEPEKEESKSVQKESKDALAVHGQGSFTSAAPPKIELNMARISRTDQMLIEEKMTDGEVTNREVLSITNSNTKDHLLHKAHVRDASDDPLDDVET